jgi:hypothetical protein
MKRFMILAVLVAAKEGTQGKIKIAEKQALYTYYFRHGHLPPGNSIFR